MFCDAVAGNVLKGIRLPGGCFNHRGQVAVAEAFVAARHNFMPLRQRHFYKKRFFKSGLLADAN
jgi:hypothetical protein